VGPDQFSGGVSDSFVGPDQFSGGVSDSFVGPDQFSAGIPESMPGPIPVAPDHSEPNGLTLPYTGEQPYPSDPSSNPESISWGFEQPRFEPSAPAPVSAIANQQLSDTGPETTISSTDQTGMTVRRPKLKETDIQVMATNCSVGHLNPPYASSCRVCSKPIPPQQPHSVKRPPLGVLRLSNGGTVLLDRPVILGRNPQIPINYTGEAPNLVQLPDPDKDISGEHIEVRLEDWHVAVKDLGSTNGTQISLPGEDPVVLRPNDPITITPGTRVVLAGVMSAVYEVAG
ncbi:MAG: hypothetical protein CSA83_01245, partial [Actinomycetales bacterium]